MVVSSVSPERWLTTAPQPASRAISIAASVSERVPIWLSLMRMALAAPSSMPRARRSGLVTKRSSTTSWQGPPGGPAEGWVKNRQTEPVVLGEAVFERDDRVAGDPVDPEVDQVGCAQATPLLRQAVGQLALGGDRGVVVEQLRDGGIEGDNDVLARTVAGALPGAQDDLPRRLLRRP